MKNNIFKKVLKKFTITSVVIIFFCGIIYGFNVKVNAASLNEKQVLSTLDDDTLYDLLQDYEVDIPDFGVNDEEVTSFIRYVISKVEEDPSYYMAVSYDVLSDFIDDITEFTKEYYSGQIETYNLVSTSSSHSLQDSLVFEDGEWVSIGGDWNPKWENYNCYAYSIKRTEEPGYYSTRKQYQPGDFSGEFRYKRGTNIGDLAAAIEVDLTSLGYEVVYNETICPSEVGDNQELICVRTGYFIDNSRFTDYHFMRYDKNTDSWYHKPGPSAVLKYKYNPTSNVEWTNESSREGIIKDYSIIYDSEIYYILYNVPSIELNCKSTQKTSVKTINEGMDTIYKVNIKCAKSYKFTSVASSAINVTFYNNDMDIIPSIIPVMSNNNSTATTITYLNPGTYYLRLNFIDSNYSGNITTEYQATYPVNDTYQVNIGENSLPTHSHFEDNYNYNLQTYFINTYDAGFYKFKLTAGNITSYPSGAIKVYKDQSRTELLDRFETDMISYSASSNINENEIYVYLPSNGIYYIDILLNNVNYSSVTMEIEEVEVNDLDYSSTLSSPAFNVVIENINKYSYFEKIIVDALSKIQIDVIASGTLNDYVPILLFKEEIDYGSPINNREYYLDTVFIGEVNPIEYIPCYTFILEPGTYYIGYIDNTDKVFMNIALTRLVEYSDNMDSILVADPYYTGYDLGTEVLFNYGECNTYTITEGFTRNIYLMVEDRLRDPMSRLEYEWYSSNESVATVSSYGTVLARQVEIDTTVKIFAVLKEDPSIVYFKEFTILNDEEEELIEIELDMSYSYSEQNGTYQLELTNTNCPYPMIQYYDFEVYEWVQEGEFDVSLNYWGQVTATGPGACVIRGTYKLNPRVKLIINLNII